jgi:hypothetical protein
MALGGSLAGQVVSFDAPRVFLGGNEFGSIVEGDFNGDGEPDLAISFQSSVATGDFNGDGNQDPIRSRFRFCWATGTASRIWQSQILWAKWLTRRASAL